MSGAFIAALVLAGILVCALPYYCVLTYRGKSKTTLIYKMALSALFLIGAFISVLHVHVRHSYMFVFLAGFILCYIGDYILGSSEKMKWFVIGSCTFGVGHMCFIAAFSLAAKRLIDGYRFFNGVELGFFCAIFAVMLLIMLWRKPPFDKLFIPMFAYYAVIVLMAAKAFNIAINLAVRAPGTVLFPIGAALFICSDYMLGLMRFKVLPKNALSKTLCTVFYYAAQMLLVLGTFSLFRL